MYDFLISVRNFVAPLHQDCTNMYNITSDIAIPILVLTVFIGAWVYVMRETN